MWGLEKSVYRTNQGYDPFLKKPALRLVGWHGGRARVGTGATPRHGSRAHGPRRSCRNTGTGFDISPGSLRCGRGGRCGRTLTLGRPRPASTPEVEPWGRRSAIRCPSPDPPSPGCRWGWGGRDSGSAAGGLLPGSSRRRRPPSGRAAAPTPRSPAPSGRPGGFVSAPYIAADSCHLLCLVTPPRAPPPLGISPPWPLSQEDIFLRTLPPARRRRPSRSGWVWAPHPRPPTAPGGGRRIPRVKACRQVLTGEGRKLLPPWTQGTEKSVMRAPF
jgi:hypothetical protein